MIHFAVAFGLLLHVLFWGAGLAMLTMPRPWRHFWTVLVVPAGLALQSAVVWAGAHAGLAGTESYAWASELVPAVLLACAWWRCGLRRAMTDASRVGLLAALVAGALALLVLPLALASRGLTTISLGSCDAADYAAGARVLQEFARDDRGGFLGLTDVVRVMSADNFFDFWLRLNHFTPSALIALNGTVLDCAPHELTSVLTMVVLAGTVPVVFWVARTVTGYSGVVSLGVALLYGISPITWYAAAHVAPAQLLAAQAIALLTWAGVALWRTRLTWRRARQFAGVLAIGYWLVLGSYNFIVVVALVPALAYAAGLTVWHGTWRRLGVWCAMMLAPLAGCAVVFFGRVEGLVERFLLFRTYDFGWRIPVLTPEGWLGMVRGPGLEPWSFFGIRWLLALVFGGAFAWALTRAVQQRRRAVWAIASMTLPVLVGYAFLEVRGARLGTNASYDAYKLFAVFYPVMLPAFCWWVTLRRSWRLTEWFGVLGLACFVVGVNLVGAVMFGWRSARPPLAVDGELRQLRKIEAMAEVTSVNVLLPHMWERLWANAFLLKKPQYFRTTTYEGREATALRGEWDLTGGVLAVELPEGGSRELTAHYALVNTRGPRFFRVEFGDGWHDEEWLARGAGRWRWSQRTALLHFENPQRRPIAVTIAWDVRGGRAGEVEFTLPDGSTVTRAIDETPRKLELPSFEIPPGRSTLTVRVPGAAVVEGDTRELGLCVLAAKMRAQK